MNPHPSNIYTAGKALAEAQKALIMIHGRGAKSEDILALHKYLNVADYALIAPQGLHYSWYPQGFMAKIEDNEPYLSGALERIGETVDFIQKAGISKNNIYFLGFSQGACLTLEFLARNADKYGGAVAYIGGFIGERIYKENYRGDFQNMPILLCTSDPDFHVPVQRVHDTSAILKDMHANITTKIYPNQGHIVTKEQLALTNELIFKF